MNAEDTLAVDEMLNGMDDLPFLEKVWDLFETLKCTVSDEQLSSDFDEILHAVGDRVDDLREEQGKD